MRLREAVNVPVTVKIRSGWDTNSINAVEVAKYVKKLELVLLPFMEELGVRAILEVLIWT